MRFSLRWLRELDASDAPDNQPSAESIAEALTSRGLTVDAVESAGDDTALDVDIPANRPDCLGHIGLARELAAAFNRPMAPALALPQAAPGLDIDVLIEDPKACRRFTASIVRGVRVGPSPAWVVERLEACGLRSINNVVDISNLVMLQVGNPIHFFDLQRFGDNQIRIRPAGDQATLVTLDGIERKLTERTLLVGDSKRGRALGGIMGGHDSEIEEDTKDVLIEAAWFDPSGVRTSTRELGMTTDASFRFVRGVDPDGTLAAQALAAHWLETLAGGTREAGFVDAYPNPHQPTQVSLRRNQLQRLLGYQPSDEETDGALAALQLNPQIDGSGAVQVTPPSWRIDLLREADIVEEVARHLGYDRIPLGETDVAEARSGQRPVDLGEQGRDLLRALGFHEAFSYAMLPPGADAPFVAPGAQAPMELANPLAEGWTQLRRSLIPGLIKAASTNMRHGVSDVRLFEVEQVFHPSAKAAELPHEPTHLALLWSGAGEARHWSRPVRQVDLYDLAGLVERTLQSLRPGVLGERDTHGLTGLHPHRALIWRGEDGQALAWGGQLHPSASELDRPTYVAELDLTALGAQPDHRPTYQPLAKVGALSRDIAVVLSPSLPYARVHEILDGVPSPAAANIEAVDSYRGAPLADDECSVTVRVTLQPIERSLTEEEIEGYRRSLLEALEKHGVAIRA